MNKWISIKFANRITCQFSNFYFLLYRKLFILGLTLTVIDSFLILAYFFYHLTYSLYPFFQTVSFRYASCSPCIRFSTMSTNPNSLASRYFVCTELNMSSTSFILSISVSVFIFATINLRHISWTTLSVRDSLLVKSVR